MSDRPIDTWTLRLREKRVDLETNFHTDSAVMKAFLDDLKLYIPGRRPLLLFGQPGVGKTALAIAIHRASKGENSPFVRVNTPDTDENLIRSEWFGHVKGAFTGATSKHKGLFEQAHKGTLFFDEFFEMEERDQKRVLRVLDSNEILRVGDDKPIAVDIRYIFGSNRTYAEVLADPRRWRLDFVSRLGFNVFTVPTLAQRIEDMPRLARDFLVEISLEDGRPRPPEIADSTLRALAQREYRANLRDLYFTLEAALPRCKGDVLLPEHLPHVGEVVPDRASIRPLDVEVRRIAERAVAACNGNRSEAATLLHIWPRRLRNILRPGSA